MALSIVQSIEIKKKSQSNASTYDIIISKRRDRIYEIKLYGTKIPGPYRPWAQSQVYGVEIPGPYSPWA